MERARWEGGQKSTRELGDGYLHYPDCGDASRVYIHVTHIKLYTLIYRLLCLWYLNKKKKNFSKEKKLGKRFEQTVHQRKYIDGK